MAYKEIPVFKDVPLYSIRVTLDGQEYVLVLDYSEREDRWILNLLDIDEKPLAVGIKLVSNWPLLKGKTTPGLPPGDLIVYDPLEGEAPGFQDLGRSCTLLYRPGA